MNHQILADAEAERQLQVDACNSVGRKLIAEARGAMKKKAEDILGMDQERLMRLAMDLVDSLAALRSAHDEYEALRRRDG